MKIIKLVALLVLSFSIICTDQERKNNTNIIESKYSHKIQLFVDSDFRHFFLKVASLFLHNQDLLDQIEFIDVSLDENKVLLKQLSDKMQVPYLIDRDADIKMAESMDILKYLVQKFNCSISFEENAFSCAVLLSKDLSIYNSATFLADVKKSNKPVIILVSTTWCPPCQQFKPIFKEVAQEQSELCEFIILDGDLNSEIVDQLEVESYPTVVCFKNGKIFNPKNYRTKSALLDLIFDFDKK